MLVTSPITFSSSLISLTVLCILYFNAYLILKYGSIIYFLHVTIYMIYIHSFITREVSNIMFLFLLSIKVFTIRYNSRQNLKVNSNYKPRKNKQKFSSNYCLNIKSQINKEHYYITLIEILSKICNSFV